MQEPRRFLLREPEVAQLAGQREPQAILAGRLVVRVPVEQFIRQAESVRLRRLGARLLYSGRRSPKGNESNRNEPIA